ncbi:alginate lyase family protein [Streptomyces sp. NPDC002952]|uniref:alginate lyase family protein n=1 Tax=Streptomyces sp. NPDC002952 TaxID=3364673 RepID=UPI0036ABF449
MRSVGRRVTAVLLAPLLMGLLASCGTSSHARSAVRARPEDGAFEHPGVLVSREQLDNVRRHVDQGEQPWVSAFLGMRDSRYGSYKWQAKPYATVACPPDTRAGRGCVEEREDAIAAYTQALLWSVTGRPEHAAKAIEIMDAWSDRVRRHTEANAGLQTAWAGSTWARAGEIVRHTKAHWPAAGVERFRRMLRTVYQPEVTKPVPDFNGNWDLVMTDAAIGIAVFLDDHRAFDAALARFRQRVPAYFYLRQDGQLPMAPAGGTVDTPQKMTTYWFGQKRYTDGVAQETCRNFKHVGYALAATAHIAETAWHQGVDLYREVEDRLRAALAFHARYQLGETPPGWLCGGKVDRDMGPDMEVALNHLEGRLDVRVPAARKLVERTRPAGTDDLFVSWETLTHAGNPAA